ncbi:MAG TPA: radical SAM family heme chaperone HemW [Chlamydiales bacterium]|nr:radical SAM family heme chaperone HemW [Chlamydiales bacterium]
MISLYFHIPFCTKKCPYCHFYVIPNRLTFRNLLSEGLELEWERQKPLLEGKTIVSVYFGGGTPSLFGVEGIAPILERIQNLSPDCEITIEANPEESSFELFSAFRSLGINRLSLGVQSLDDRALGQLERIHSAEKAKEAIFHAQKAGFENISIDLMYDLPDQTEESWRYTLNQLHELPIQHLSLYNLTIEPHTAFHKRKVKTPPSDTSLQLLNMALEKLDAIGLHRYEISAFARNGLRSRHNLGYWTGRPFLGLGPSAFSYWEGERFRNIANIQRYIRLLKQDSSPVDFRERLPHPAHLKELLAVQLRVKEGVGEENIPADSRDIVEKLVNDGFLYRHHNHIRLTEKGMLFYDTVASELI